MTWLLCDYGEVLSLPQSPEDLAGIEKVAGRHGDRFWADYWAHRPAYDLADISVADYWSETRPVQARFAKNLSMVLPVRFDAETLEKLRLEASKKGIGPTTLVRMLILQHFDEASPGDVATIERRKQKT